MRRLLLFIVVLAVAVGALGFWRGWFSLTNEGALDVQVDADKFNQDRDAFSQSFSDKVQATKDKIASLREKSEGLTSAEKALVQQELNDLETKHTRLERQIKELNDAGQGRFQSIQQDLSKTLEEVEQKIEELTTKLEQDKLEQDKLEQDKLEQDKLEQDKEQ